MNWTIWIDAYTRFYRLSTPDNQRHKAQYWKMLQLTQLITRNSPPRRNWGLREDFFAACCLCMRAGPVLVSHCSSSLWSKQNSGLCTQGNTPNLNKLYHYHTRRDGKFGTKFGGCVCTSSTAVLSSTLPFCQGSLWNLCLRRFLCYPYTDSLRARRSGSLTPMGARFSAPVQNGPGAHPASYTMGNSYPSRT
jgi:hypothetical protein